MTFLMRYYSRSILLVFAALAATVLLSACSPLAFVERQETAAPAWTVTALNASPAVSEASDRSVETRPTADPLIPTVMPVAVATLQLTVTAPPTSAVVSPESASAAGSSPLGATSTPSTEPPAARPPREPDDLRRRLGVGVPLGATGFQFDEQMARRLGLGWYLDWDVESQPIRTDGLEFAQMVRVRGSKFFPSRSEIARGFGSQPRLSVADWQ